METSFLPDRFVISLPSLSFVLFFLVLGLTFDLRGDEDALSVSGRRRNKLSVKDCRGSGFLSRSRFKVIQLLLCQYFCIWQHRNKVWTESSFSCTSDEPLEITYSYWDGAGHRRVIQVNSCYVNCILFVIACNLLFHNCLGDCYSFSIGAFAISLPLITFLIIQARKGDTIGEFLRAVQQQLAPEFREIRTTSVENLLYVKEDLIIPHVKIYWKQVFMYYIDIWLFYIC